MTLTKRQLFLVTLVLSLALAAGAVLLCGCGSQKAETPMPVDDDPSSGESDLLYGEDGIWSTDGNVWYTSSGDCWSTDGNCWYSWSWFYPFFADNGTVLAAEYQNDWRYYATAGDCYATYGNAEQLTLYATDGNCEPTYEVRVTNVDELLSSLADNTRILLSPGEYDLNAASPALYEHCYFRPTFDGEHELVLCNLCNCIIEGEQTQPLGACILQGDSSAPVLTLDGCYCMQLNDLVLGHTTNADCFGSVIYAHQSSDVYISGCDLYGCGTFGLQTTECSSFTMENCRIHDCSYGAADINGGEAFLFRNCDFEHTGTYNVLSCWSCGWVEVDSCEIHEIEAGGLLSCYGTYRVYLDDCSIHDNTFDTYYYLSDCHTPPELNRCKFTNSPYSRRMFSDTWSYEGAGVLVDGELVELTLPGKSEETLALEDFMNSFFDSYMSGDAELLDALVSEEVPRPLKVNADAAHYREVSPTGGLYTQLNGAEYADYAVDGDVIDVNIGYQYPDDWDFHYLFLTLRKADTPCGWT